MSTNEEILIKRLPYPDDEWRLHILPQFHSIYPILSKLFRERCALLMQVEKKFRKDGVVPYVGWRQIPQETRDLYDRLTKELHVLSLMIDALRRAPHNDDIASIPIIQEQAQKLANIVIAGKEFVLDYDPVTRRIKVGVKGEKKRMRKQELRARTG